MEKSMVRPRVLLSGFSPSPYITAADRPFTFGVSYMMEFFVRRLATLIRLIEAPVMPVSNGSILSSAVNSGLCCKPRFTAPKPPDRPT
ncbi:hypothetical protein D3C72_1671030 [compost metagenome]